MRRVTAIERLTSLTWLFIIGSGILVVLILASVVYIVVIADGEISDREQAGLPTPLALPSPTVTATPTATSTSTPPMTPSPTPTATPTPTNTPGPATLPPERLVLTLAAQQRDSFPSPKPLPGCDSRDVQTWQRAVDAVLLAFDAITLDFSRIAPSDLSSHVSEIETMAFEVVWTPYPECIAAARGNLLDAFADALQAFRMAQRGDFELAVLLSDRVNRHLDAFDNRR